MRSRIVWTILLILAIISPCARATIWNPNTDPNLGFNLNFEQNKVGPPPETNDVGPLRLVGTAYDYNNTDPNNPFHMWDSNSSNRIIGTYFGNFSKTCDANTTKKYDCKVRVPDDWYEIFMMGNAIVGGDEFDKRRHTFTFWFDVPNISSGGTIIRHANKDDVTYPDTWWEIGIYDGRLKFVHKQDVLRVETEQTLEGMGILPNTWHHAAVVYDMTAREASQMFVDGVQVDRLVTSYVWNGDAEIDNTFSSPVQFGSGDAEFEGLLDEIRIYNRVLSPAEVSILYQTDGSIKPYALNPFPNASNVPVTTNLQWEPIAGGTAQSLYFGTDPCNFGAAKKTGDGAMNSATNAEIRGDSNSLALGTTYYWDVNTTVGGNIIPGRTWKFTTETGEAYDPTPADGQEDVNVGATDLKWKGTPSTINYKVYFSNNESFVEDMCDAALVPDNNIFDTNVAVTTTLRAENYYWCVESNLVPEVNKLPVDSNVWTFRTKPYPIVFNTDNNDVNYAGQIIPGYKCMRMEPDSSWTTLATGSIDSNSGDGVPVIVFDFDSFVYNNRYDIIVLPQYGAGVDDNTVTPTPLAIHTVGDFNFDGRMDICGEDVTVTDATDANARARCGGHRGPRSIDSDTKTVHPKEGSYYDGISLIAYERLGNDGANRPRFEVSVLGVPIFGVGAGGTSSYINGGGGGYGGMGGISGRGYFFAQYDGGITYGDKEVPMPFGGSAGGFGKNTGTGGGAGGGGVEIVAGGSVILGSNAKILAEGGNIVAEGKYPGGGGSGGSVRIIADVNVLNRGIIDVNGGKGGNGTEKGNNNGGGGGGGRVAIFYGGSYTNTGQITAEGGERGVTTVTSQFAQYNAGRTLAEDGQDGTIFVVKSSPVRRKASAPTPKNGDTMVYCPNSSTGNWLTLKWHSGYNKTDACDIVYFGSSPVTLSPKGLVSAKRGQRSCPNDVNVVKDQTYYWKVQTIAADGNAESDLWSFKTVNWICRKPYSSDPNNYYSIWDAYPPDCVVNNNDFSYFSEHWREQRGGEKSPDAYTIEPNDLSRLSVLWLECRGRTNDGCAGW